MLKVYRVWFSLDGGLVAPEDSFLEACDCLMTGWTSVLIVYRYLLARYRGRRTSSEPDNSVFTISQRTTIVRDLLFLYTLHNSMPRHSGLFIHMGLFRISFSQGSRINLCDALYSEKLNGDT